MFYKCRNSKNIILKRCRKEENMVREEDYRRYLERIHNSKNSSRDRNISLAPNRHALPFHIKRINDYVNNKNSTNPATQELMEQDFCVSLNEALKIMDAHGWA